MSDIPPSASPRPTIPDDESLMSDPPDRPGDLRTQAWTFLVVGNAVGTMSLVYLLTDDDAGQMMLGVASLLGLMCGGYLWFHLRRRRTVGTHARVAAERAESGPSPDYLPHSSIWPFGIGVAAFLVANGLILGQWFLVPGALVMAICLLGFARQSRHRD